MLKLETLYNFIQAQPDERPVDIYEGMASDPVGCVLIHYGKDNNIPITYAGFGFYYTNEKEHNVEGSGVLDLIDSDKCWKTNPDIKTYGELKKVLLPC